MVDRKEKVRKKGRGKQGKHRHAEGA